MFPNHRVPAYGPIRLLYANPINTSLTLPYKKRLSHGHSGGAEGLHVRARSSLQLVPIRIMSSFWQLFTHAYVDLHMTDHSFAGVG